MNYSKELAETSINESNCPTIFAAIFYGFIIYCITVSYGATNRRESPQKSNEKDTE